MLATVLHYWQERRLRTRYLCKGPDAAEPRCKQPREQPAAGRDGVFTSVDVGNYA